MITSRMLHEDRNGRVVELSATMNSGYRIPPEYHQLVATFAAEGGYGPSRVNMVGLYQVDGPEMSYQITFTAEEMEALIEQYQAYQRELSARPARQEPGWVELGPLDDLPF